MQTDTGIRKAAAYVDMPVRAVMTAAPPRISMALTMMLVRKQKKKNTCRRKAVSCERYQICSHKLDNHELSAVLLIDSNLHLLWLMEGKMRAAITLRFVDLIEGTTPL